MSKQSFQTMLNFLLRILELDTDPVKLFDLPLQLNFDNELEELNGIGETIGSVDVNTVVAKS